MIKLESILAFITALVTVLVALAHFPWLEPEQSGSSLGQCFDWDEYDRLYQESISKMSLPSIQRFTARDNARLAYRLYQAAADKASTTAIFHHGTASDGRTLHGIATELSKRGWNVYVPDLRGVGESAVAGDGHLDYQGQIDDDLRDFLTRVVSPGQTTSKLVFCGHSSQGGASWNLASIPEFQDTFDAFISIAPMLGLTEETVQPIQNSNWCVVNLPSMLSLMALNQLGITSFNSRMVVRFFGKPGSTVNDQIQEIDYNMQSFTPMVSKNYQDVAKLIPKSVRLLHIQAGKDELMQDVTSILKSCFPSGEYKVIPRTHFAVLFDNATIDAIYGFTQGCRKVVNIDMNMKLFAALFIRSFMRTFHENRTNKSIDLWRGSGFPVKLR